MKLMIKWGKFVPKVNKFLELNLFYQMFYQHYRMIKNKTRPGIFHYFADHFTMLGIIAMNLAYSASTFIAAKRTFVNSGITIINKGFAFFAKALVIMMVIAIKFDHYCDNLLIIFYEFLLIRHLCKNS